MNLCARVNLKARRVVRNGVGYVGLVSSHRTQVCNEGDCKRTTAEIVLWAGRGVFGAALITEGKLCFGGFAPVKDVTHDLSGGHLRNVTAALRGVLSGDIVMFSSSRGCILRGSGAAGGWPDCPEPPDVHRLCLYPYYDGGWTCLYCGGQTAAVRGGCKVEVLGAPCGALGEIGNPFMVLPGSAARIVPEPGHFDIYGDDGEFLSNDGLTGTVKYYLRSWVRLHVDPVIDGREIPPGCDACTTWLCTMLLHNLSSPWSYRLVCTSVLKRDEIERAPGACCWHDGETMHCFDNVLLGECTQIAGIWMGPHSRCEFSYCENPEISTPGLCCLPHQPWEQPVCQDLTLARCNELGGRFFPYARCDMSDWVCDDRPDTDVDINLMLRPVNISFRKPIGFMHFNFGGGHCFKLYDNQCFIDPQTALAGFVQFPSSGTHARHLDSLPLDFSIRLDASSRHPSAEPGCVDIANQALGRVGEFILAVTNHPGRAGWYDGPLLNVWWEERLFSCNDAPAVCSIDVLDRETPIMFPAELVISQIGVNLWLSADTAPYLYQQYDPPKARIAAFLHVVVYLKVRAQPDTFVCAEVFNDPARYKLLASGCTRVPRKVSWRGLVGPRPWSKAPFEFMHPDWAAPCYLPLCGIDELVIPGEVNDTSDPDAVQRYDGDVVVLVGWDRDAYGHCP